MTDNRCAKHAKSSEHESSHDIFCPSLFEELKIRQNEVDNIEAFTREGHMTLRAVFNPKASTSTIVESKFLESELPSSVNGQEFSSDGVALPGHRTMELGWYFKSEAKSYTETLMIIPDKEGTGVALGIDVVIGGDSEYYRIRLRNVHEDGENGKPDGRVAVIRLGKQSKKEKEEQKKKKKEKEKERKEQEKQQEERDKERERKENKEASKKGGSEK